MSLGSTPDTLFYEIIFLLATFPLFFVLLAVGGFLRRLLNIQSGILGFFVIVLPLAGTIVGTSLYLDRAGVVAPAQVVKKTETVHVRKEGDWRHRYEVQVQYTTADGANPSARFSTAAAVFDTLHEGGKVAVRTVSINGWFNLARLADQSTWTWIPWRWVTIGLSIILLGWLGWQFFNNKIGCALLGLVAAVLVITPFLFKFSEWHNSENLDLTPLRATGIITEMQRVTEVDPLPGDGGSGDEWETSIEVAQQYDIVVVRYTPRGYVDPVLGVDAIDVGSQAVTLDMMVEIAYGSTDPRTVRLLHGTRSHHWKNPVEWLKQQALAIAVCLLFIGGLHWVGKWWQQLLKRRTLA